MPRDGDEGERQREREVEQLREEVRRLRAELEARDDFLARAAHELRNPMSSVVLIATNLVFLARRDLTTPRAIVERLDQLRQHANYFVRRATTLLEASRLAAGHAAIDRTTFDLGSVVLQVVNEHAPQAERSRCRLDLDIVEGIVGCWDRPAIESIASNLISNAIKYGAGSPVRVSVSGTPDLGVLTVADEGPGISPEDQARIFERFERAGPRSERPGFGIGLWIARQFAVAHGGDLSVDSAKGRGSAFTASLPRAIYEPPHERS